ncbi:MAG: TIGR01777 family oxidoreductase [Chitinophagaceae bacterium]
MTTILITGGTGLIGKALTKKLLEKGYRVIILTRGEERSAIPGSNLSYARWDIEKQWIDKHAVEATDHIIHLAGAGIADKRWSKKRKQEIVDSRVNSSRLLADTLERMPNKVKTVVSASAIGWYGSDKLRQNDDGFEETAAPADDFLGETCRQWEASIEPVNSLGIRLVKLRTGIVLSREGGALKEFMRPLQFAVAAILGTGKQVISWIQIHDMVDVYIAAIENSSMTGVYNTVAPAPVTSKELTLQLARARRKFFIPVHVPAFILKIILGEMSIEVLKSATVSNKKLKATGFSFQYPSIDSILKS